VAAEFHPSLPERINIRHEAQEEIANVIHASWEDGGKPQLIDKDEQDVRLRPGDWFTSSIEREARVRRCTRAGQGTGRGNPYGSKEIPTFHVRSFQYVGRPAE